MILTGELVTCKVSVERIISQLDKGCIFSAKQDGGKPVRVKYSGSDVRPLPGDAYEVTGYLGSWRDRFGREVAQIDSKRMHRTVTTGALIGPWLQKLPNIGEQRSARLQAAFGYELAKVFSDYTRVGEVAVAVKVVVA